MAKVATELLKEAFIEPIRFALLLDDKFPIYQTLAEGKFDPALDNPRAKALFELCRGRGWLCDVDNRSTVAEKFEEDNHLHQSDLLILDFNLDPLDQNDPTAALKILQRLAASDHFNLVIVYTNADAVSVTRDIVFSLGGGGNLKQASAEAVRTVLEDLESGVLKDVEQALTWGTIDDYLRGVNPRESAKDIRGLLSKAGVKPELLANVILHLASERMRKDLKREVLERRPQQSDSNSSLGQAGPVQWATQGNVFVAVVNKAEEPAVLVDRLVEALAAWDPSPLHVMMMHARSAVEKAGTLADRKVLETPRLQAGWLLRILLGTSDLERRESVGELYSRLFERLAHKVEPSIVDFGLRIINPSPEVDPVASAKALAGGFESLDAHQIYHALNEHLSSDACPDGPMTTGVIFRGARGNAEQFWLCTSPACDLVPGQNLRGWDGDLKPLRPVSVTRLKLVKNATSVTKALRQATFGRHLFLLIDRNPFAFEVMEDKSRQMEIEVALLEGNGRIVDGRFRGHVIDLDEERRPVFSTIDFQVLAKLRSDYANRLLTQSGQQRSRIGVDFIDLPSPTTEE